MFDVLMAAMLRRVNSCVRIVVRSDVKAAFESDYRQLLACAGYLTSPTSFLRVNYIPFL